MNELARIAQSQFEAALAMLAECLDGCPDQHWDSPIARYTFWQVAYHTLCFADCYLARGDDAWQPHPTFHPAGRAELDGEYPSRRFTRRELIAYLGFCLDKVRTTFAAETTESLQSPSGFPRHPFSRGELHLYNLRHIQHHTGQLSAFLRRVGIDTGWVKAGWR